MSRNLRLPELCARVGLSRPVIYRRIKAGVMPPPIKLGPKASAWPESEVADIMCAVAGKATDVQLRALVESMVAARTERARAVLQRTQ
jgi:prophage regulatory protein